MAFQNRMFNKEERIALLKECVASDLTMREYAALRQVGHSTLGNWAKKAGISLAKKNRRLVRTQTQSEPLYPYRPDLPGSGLPGQALAQPGGLGKGTVCLDIGQPSPKHPAPFSFIDITGQAPLLQQACAAPHLCSLEIATPNGVVLKVESGMVFGDLWPHVIEFVCGTGGV